MILRLLRKLDMDKNRNRWILASIFLLGLFLRLYNLGSLPNGFHVDELNAGYIGRYILLHGRDVLGNLWPLTYDSFGDFRPTGIFYLSGLSTFLFGINEFAVRFPSAILGALTIISIYLLAKELFESETVGILAAFILSVLPWHVVLSRATSEGVIGLFFISLGLWFLVKGIRTKKRKEIFLGGVALLLTYFFYHSFRLLVPLVVFPFIFYPKIEKKEKTYVTGILGISFVLTVVLGFSLAGVGRFSQVAFYKNPILPNTIESLQAGEGSGHVMRARAFHNKGVIYIRELMTQYVSYFSPHFLLISGGLPDRYVVPHQGLFTFALAVFLGVGLLGIFELKKMWLSLTLLFLALVAPLPAALTYEDAPNVHRSIVLIFPIVLLMGYGLSIVIGFLRDRSFGQIFSVICFVLLGLEVVYFWHQYSIHAATHRGFLRNDGTKEAIELVQKNHESFNRVYMSIYDGLPMFYLFYTGNFEKQHSGTFNKETSQATIDNVTFIGAGCISEKLSEEESVKNILVVDSGDCKTPRNFIDVKTIMRRDSTRAYTFFVSGNSGEKFKQ